MERKKTGDQVSGNGEKLTGAMFLTSFVWAPVSEMETEAILDGPQHQVVYKVSNSIVN